MIAYVIALAGAPIVAGLILFGLYVIAQRSIWEKPRGKK